MYVVFLNFFVVNWTITQDLCAADWRVEFRILNFTNPYNVYHNPLGQTYCCCKGTCYASLEDSYTPCKETRCDVQFDFLLNSIPKDFRVFNIHSAILYNSHSTLTFPDEPYVFLIPEKVSPYNIYIYTYKRIYHVYLLQRLVVVVMRGNPVSVLGTIWFRTPYCWLNVIIIIINMYNFVHIYIYIYIYIYI